MPLSPSFPELAALDLYASVVDLGSVSRAARAHNIAQPSASSRIRNLERQLGVTLLVRSPSGSTPTAEGIVVAGWAEAILSAAEELEAGLSALKAEQTGRLRISSSFTIAEYLLPRWLGQFSRDHPTDVVALSVANSTTVLEHLARGRADLGFVESPLDAPGMDSRTVAHDRLVTVVAPDHPWAARRSVPIAELASTPLVMREEGSGTRAALVAELERAGYSLPSPVLELGSTAAVRSAVSAGSSPTVISRLAVAAAIADGHLVEVSVAELDIPRRLRAVWPEGQALPPLASQLLESIVADP